MTPPQIDEAKRWIATQDRYTLEAIMSPLPSLEQLGYGLLLFDHEKRQQVGVTSYESAAMLLLKPLTR